MAKFMMRLASSEGDPMLETQVIEARYFDADRAGNLSFFGDNNALVAFVSAGAARYVVQQIEEDEPPPPGTRARAATGAAKKKK